jgi:hypothetical protein
MSRFTLASLIMSTAVAITPAMAQSHTVAVENGVASFQVRTNIPRSKSAASPVRSMPASKCGATPAG